MLPTPQVLFIPSNLRRPTLNETVSVSFSINKNVEPSHFPPNTCKKGDEKIKSKRTQLFRNPQDSVFHPRSSFECPIYFHLQPRHPRPHPSPIRRGPRPPPASPRPDLSWRRVNGGLGSERSNSGRPRREAFNQGHHLQTPLPATPAQRGGARAPRTSSRARALPAACPPPRSAQSDRRRLGTRQPWGRVGLVPVASSGLRLKTAGIGVCIKPQAAVSVCVYTCNPPQASEIWTFWVKNVSVPVACPRRRDLMLGVVWGRPRLVPKDPGHTCPVEAAHPPGLASRRSPGTRVRDATSAAGSASLWKSWTERERSGVRVCVSRA